MGRPKQSVVIDGRSLLDWSLDCFEGLGGESIVVLAPGSEAPSERAELRRIVNPHPDRGMMSSIAAGLAALANDDAWAFVLPVDCPGVRAQTAALLIDAVRGTESAAAVPMFRGRRGHPVLLGPPAVSAALRAAEHPGGAPSSRTTGAASLANVLAELGDAVRIVPVDDPGVLGNVNRPEDVERLRAEMGTGSPEERGET